MYRISNLLKTVILCITVAYAGKPVDMKTLYLNKGCSSCHGLYGEGIGDAPQLRGKPADLLAQRLKNLKNGKTRTPFGTVMITFAQSMSDTEIDNMAVWLSGLKKPKENEIKERYELDNFFDNTGDGSS